MSGTVVARRYAKALFAVGKEEGKLQEYGDALAQVASFLEENPEIEAALASPVFPLESKGAIIDEVVKAFGVTGELAALLSLMAERNRLMYLRQVAEHYRELLDEETGVVRAVVRTAVPISDELKQRMAEAFAKVVGRQVELEVKEDPEIIGGVIAHIGDVIWDGSIRSQLQGFKESIGRGELV